MRWDQLFDDLESQLDQEQRDEERALALEEERLRLGRLTLPSSVPGVIPLESATPVPSPSATTAAPTHIVES